MKKGFLLLILDKKEISKYHLLKHSPWPILTSLLTPVSITIIIYTTLKLSNPNMFFLSSITLIVVIFLWWRDVRREAESGQHSLKTYKLIQIGILILILSEILFFFGFFWTFFWLALENNIRLGIKWPPTNIVAFDPFGVPLINRTILLSSGSSVTWSHYGLIQNYHNEIINGLIVTILLGVIFTLTQAYEYYNRFFSISDSCYGSIFFIITGFHGVHVIAGSIILTVALKRAIKGVFRENSHNNLELAIWYWHFVDVVWLFLFLCVYWWSF